MLVPGLKRNIFSTPAAAQKRVKTIIEMRGSSLDLGVFSVQLTRLKNTDPLDLTIAKKRRRTKSALCVISGETFGRESVLTVLVPKKPVALSVGSINVDQSAVKNILVGDKNGILTYKIHNTKEDVSFCEQIEGNTLSPTMKSNGKKG